MRSGQTMTTEVDYEKAYSDLYKQVATMLVDQSRKYENEKNGWIAMRALSEWDRIRDKLPYPTKL